MTDTIPAAAPCRPLPHTRAALIMLAVTAVLSVFVTWPREARPSLALAERIPREIEGWSGADEQVEKRTLEILGTDDVLSRTYYGGRGAPPVHFLVIFARHTRRATHPPEICLKGEGWATESMATRPVNLGPQRGEFPVRELVMLRQEQRLLVLYFFKHASYYSADYWSHQLRVALAKLINPNASDTMVRVETIVAPSEALPAARARAERFLRAIFPDMDRCLTVEKEAGS